MWRNEKNETAKKNTGQEKKLSKIRKKLGNGGDRGVEEEVDKGRRMRQAKKRDTRIRGGEER